MKSRFIDIMNERMNASYIAPLFWQHGEHEDILRDEIRQMNKSGIGSFIVESRPHPEYLTDGWWRDLDIIVDEARNLNMKVWLLDDYQFPSGFAAGKARDLYPEHLKVYIAERHIDAVGPLKESSFLIDLWMEKGDRLLGVVAAKRVDGEDIIDSDSLIDIGDQVMDGILYWDVPEGAWRVFIFLCTRHGGEKYTEDYINPIDEQAVSFFIDQVYEAHYNRYAEEFGQTIAGFFTDEPRFGNAPSYDASLGRKMMEFPYGGVEGPSGYSQFVLPYSDALFSLLNEAWKSEASVVKWLPLLWYDGGAKTASVRYTFMNVVSKLFAKHYTKQIGDWCRERSVKLIGHVVEDNGAHSRLGFGSGHFFRSISGMDCSGVDVVYQIWPEYLEGRFNTPFGYLDAEFFYWGMIKMASSAAHIDPKKQGTTICEAFGAYGWQEGLKLMKWITDHICVRGVNYIIPHAFSPKFPDTDCPPHFYARGENPQWRFFSIWSSYANRICHLLSGGRHVAPVAVIYHAEAEWSGTYQPFQKVVKTLALSQIDCDVIPIDALVLIEKPNTQEGKLNINDEWYQAIVVPYSECLPEDFINALIELTFDGIQIVFIDNVPSRSIECSDNLPHLLKELAERTEICKLDQLVDRLREKRCYDIQVSDFQESLRYYHYVREDEETYFLTNESKYRAVHTTVIFKEIGVPVAYDALNHEIVGTNYYCGEFVTTVDISLQPFQSIFIIFFKNNELQKRDWIGLHPSAKSANLFYKELQGDWKISLADAKSYPNFKDMGSLRILKNISKPELFPFFSGTIRYEICFDVEEPDKENIEIIDLNEAYEITEVWLNDSHLGVRICPPYTYRIKPYILNGLNQLRIEVTNTLVKQIPTVFDRAMSQEPSGLMGPVIIKSTGGKLNDFDKQT